MELCCNLEVEVNGEATFIVDERIILSFSGRLRKLIRNTVGVTRSSKVVLHGFPGGSEGFEEVLRFCYNGGRIEISPTNVVLLHYAAYFLKLEVEGHGSHEEFHQLLAETEKYLHGANFWSWHELLLALKQCQICLPIKKDSFMGQILLDCIIGRLGLSTCESTYTSSSSESSSSRYSYETRSHNSLTSNLNRITWWFQDLAFFNIVTIEKLTRTMISRNLDHKIICKFLFYYRKSQNHHSDIAEKHKIMERVIDLLDLLDQSLLSYKGITDIYQAALSLKIRKKYKHKLEILMGSQLDKLTVSHLLIPAPFGKDYMYDVNFVLRLVKFFQVENRLCYSKFERVGDLIDSYLMEVAPDSHLKASKFRALAMSFPYSRRKSHDKLYQAIDMYLQVHVELCEDEKINVCSALNYSKLSAEFLKDLVQNPKIPSRTAVKSSFITRKFNSIDLFCDTVITRIFRDTPLGCSVHENTGKKR